MASPPAAKRSEAASMPPEWAPHEATWLAWPHDPRTWIAGVDAAETAFLEMIEALVPGERVELIVTDDALARTVRARLVDRGLDVVDPVYRAGPKGQAVPLVEAPPTPPEDGVVRLHLGDHVDAWVRDYGPTFTRDPQTGQRIAIDWRFDAWGGKYEALKRDDRLGRFIAEVHGARRRRPDLVTEGGAIEVDGEGTLITTEPCLIDPDRNPGASRAEVEATLRELLGVETIVWLPAGLVGDDTDGHVDTLARFLGPTTLALPVETDAEDPNHAPLAANRERIDAWLRRHRPGTEVVELPMPAPVRHDGQRFPASYANFYIGNEVLLLPVFDDPADGVAQARLEDRCPDRRVVPVEASALIVGYGSCHCLTQQVPNP